MPFTGVVDAQGQTNRRIVRDTIPGSLVSFEMVQVPAGRVTVPARGGTRTVTLAPYLIGRTELTWDAYDAFTLSGEPSDRGAPIDAKSRPSRPYGAPDYGWGHRGFPTMSVARDGAEAFCAWLSAKTGKRYRLPTEAEWQHAANLAAGGTSLSVARRNALSWHRGNSGSKTHAVGTQAADALGLFDLFGNVAEWVKPEDGGRVVRGGSFRDPIAGIGPTARAIEDDSWNERDPQIPKSRWWLSDGPFIGFRIVREP